MSGRSLKERFFHAVGFEVLAIALVSPAAAWIMDKPLFQMGALAIMLSTVAMIWNMIYNAGFDRLWPRDKVTRGLGLRIFHAVAFECGFILIGLPLAAWMLGISLWQALMIEIGFFLFFLPYTVVYNWLYDKIRDRIVTSRHSQPLNKHG
ncbi:multidrug/biocide efflux PACE transporter [Erwinia sorbitola]|uniref:Multidrug/biocide efflux PACE transporter n=1 Tax=Erwinia sorbitola TaxID=2681984 RepID=A0A6I6EPF3_9GAMM|nr:multidrug/biocide efflux PACE transporter [Erwinia sorbitola]MTD27053.1 multidrug/biocide efflux PACE transporter [Erwinia sorbitola]QGU88611.1 multidrug/biocide efflux PACE transporter [Erwinia sorbitola]